MRKRNWYALNEALIKTGKIGGLISAGLMLTGIISYFIMDITEKK